MIVPVILAGGSGSRLWPMSRHQFPKQFLTLENDQSLLQATLSRIEGLEQGPPIILGHQDHRFIVAEQLRELNITDGTILLEPEGKNTAPAIALAALHACQQSSDAQLLVMAADHVIRDEKAFCEAIKRAQSLAQDGLLVTFGIVPHAPETGYGYIKQGEPLAEHTFKVEQFVEKPDLERAQRYLQSGAYLWNSGIFLFKASAIIQALKTHCPAIFAACEQAYEKASRDLDFIRIDPEHFAQCPEDSIDYAVMERAQNVAVVPVDCGWSDVGSWSAYWEVSDKDESGNACRGDVIVRGCSNSYFHSQDKLIAAVGVEDVVLIDTKDATLLAKRSDVQRVKEIVNELKATGRSQWLHHREVYRPWGQYDSLDSGERFQVKRITVKPGEKLSMQMHHHRAEHWIVVSGTAKVTNGDEHYLLTENQSTYIPLGAKHSLENPGMVPLELIEVQSGAYLEEDDIVRFSDRYGRV